MINQYTYSKKEMIKQKMLTIFSIIKGKKDLLFFEGKYHDWETAKKKCEGYDSAAIWEKVKDAALKVKNGDAVFERDSYLFNEEHYNYPIVCFLLELYLKMNYLNVIDFGGSLGSMYFQHKSIFDTVENLEWNIIEQKHFIDFGKENLENDHLKFHYSMNEIEKSNCILFGSSLQYIVNYDEYLKLAILKGPKYIIIDKTPVSDEEWYSIEYVHEPIYESSYPLHVFKRDDLIARMKEGGEYILRQNWQPETGEWFFVENKKCFFESFIFEKKNNEI